MNCLLGSFGDGEIFDRIGVPATLEPKFLIPETIRRMRTSVRGNDLWDCLGLQVDWLMVALDTIDQS